MDKALRTKIRAMGDALTPEMFRGTAQLFAPLASRPDPRSCLVERDLAYGAHERHRLDLYLPASLSDDAPALIYVHGGGFMQGDKGGASDPFYQNVGSWAAAQGIVGVTMNYRLAPAHPWPSGAEDISAAIEWLVENASRFGFSGKHIFLMGQSAGAAHVAAYVAMPWLHVSGPHLSGAIMLSGIYDVERLDHSPFEAAYFGTDRSRFSEQSTLPGLTVSSIPCLFTVAEHDGANFQQQAALLVEAWMNTRKRWPRILYLPDGNHMSGAVGLGVEGDLLALEIQAFIDRFSEEQE